MLDADCDETGRRSLTSLICETCRDGRTHPWRSSTFLAGRLPDWNFGYALQPRLREQRSRARGHPHFAARRRSAGRRGGCDKRDCGARGSVTWGQGLLEPQKIHALLAAALASGEPVRGRDRLLTPAP